ncbi:MAG: HAD-IIA family hydrolase [Mobilicoccus sp.]|nr:HAD-IIA family hydrolase [Mobilicoccus sp.]
MLAASYRGIVCDLDGVVYTGPAAVPWAVEALTAVRGAGVGIIYATNNASRRPETVADHLRELGVELDLEDVLTSAMAGAAELAELIEPGSVVLAVGGEGVVAALQEQGFTPIRTADVGEHTPVAVLQGFGRDVAWTDLAEAGYAINAGARWVVTNPDLTVPTDRGIAIGNGSIAGALRHAVDVDPVIVGKPYPPLYQRCAGRLGCAPEQTLAVGDRLDTDIEGANRTGMDSLCVLTGVSGPLDLILADELRSPTHVAVDLRALLEPYVAAEVVHDAGTVTATCSEARVVMTADHVELSEGGAGSERLRALVAAGRAILAADRPLPALDAAHDWIRSAS